MRYDLIAHITGAPGAGKTTLLNDLSRRHPGLITKDTDDFDNEAAAIMGYQSHEIWDLNAEQRWWHHEIRKTCVVRWMTAHDGLPIVTAGYYWTRPEHPEAPAIFYKVRLNTGPLQSAWRAWRREQRNGVIRDGLHHWFGRARRQIARLDTGGYVPRSRNAILHDLASMVTRWPEL